jgi:hypothetical protein
VLSYFRMNIGERNFTWLRTGAFEKVTKLFPNKPLANGAGRHDINDDAELHVEEIVATVREGCRSLVCPSTGPLIGRGDKSSERHR